MDLKELFQQGGPLMWAILIASIVGVGVFLERLWSTQRSKVLPRAFVDRIRALVAKGKTNEALLLCEENASSIALVIAAALRAFEHSTTRGDIKEAVEEVGAREVAHMDRNVEVVGTVATISPLLGLLGTVIGMIRMFLAILNSGIGDANQMAGGIGEALVCTAAGLCVAIPAYIFHRHLRAKVAGLGIELEKEVVALIDVIEAEVPVQVAAARRAAK